MDTATKTKKAAILSLMHGFPSSQDRITAETIGAYLDALSECSPEAVQRSCQQFARGLVSGHNNAFPPSASELAANAAEWDHAIAVVTASQEMRKIGRTVPYKIGEKPPPPLEPLGPTKLEIGGRVVDVSHLTLEEKETAIRTGRMPDEASAEIEGRKVPMPKLQRF